MRKRITVILVLVALVVLSSSPSIHAQNWSEESLGFLRQGLENLDKALTGQVAAQRSQAAKLVSLEQAVHELKRKSSNNGNHLAPYIIGIGVAILLALIALWLSILRLAGHLSRLPQEVKVHRETGKEPPPDEVLLPRLEVIEAICLPPNPEPYLRLAEERAKNGHFRNARDLYLQATQRFTNNHEAYHGLAKVLARMGNLEEAIGYFKKVASIRPRDLAILSELAETQLRAGQFDAAVQTYDQILAADQSNAAVHLNKAEALARLGKLLEALQALNLALDKWPDDQDLQVEKARILIDLGEYSAALKALNEVLSKNACHAMARYNKACCLAKIGDQRLTREELLRALEIDHNLGDIAAQDPDLRAVWGDGVWVGQALIKVPDRSEDIRIVARMEGVEDEG